MVTREVSRPGSAEQRLQELGIKLPAPPEPFGTLSSTADPQDTRFTDKRSAVADSRVHPDSLIPILQRYILVTIVTAP